MDVNSYVLLEKNLFSEIGKEKVEKVVDDLIKIIVANNFDSTPTTLEEILNYTKQTILLRKI